MTEFKQKKISLFIILLPILSLFIKKPVINEITYSTILKIILSIYFITYMLFKSNSKFKKYNRFLLLIGFFCLLYMKVNLNNMRLIYIKEYILFVLNFMFFPFTLISFLCIYDDYGIDSNKIKNLFCLNSVFYCAFGLIFTNYITSNLVELSLIYIILYYFLLDKFKPNIIQFILFGLIIYNFTKVGTINLFISFIIIGLLNIIKKKNKSSITLFLVTLLFLIINYNGSNNYFLNYNVSILNIFILSIPVIAFLTGLIYNIKNGKIKINMNIVSLSTVLIIVFLSLVKGPLVQNLVLFNFYYILTLIIFAKEIKYLEKMQVTDKITLIAPLNFGVNEEKDFIDLANYLGKKCTITVLFPYERNNPFKGENITILYLSDNKKFIKEKLRKFIMQDNSKVLISFDNETNKLINDYSLKDAVKIAFKQGDFISLAYKKFLTKRLRNIDIVVFTSKKALNVYKSVLENKRCYKASELDVVLSKIIKEGE